MPPWDIDLIGKLEASLNPFKEEFMREYQSGKDELEKHSNSSKYIVLKNVEVQVERLSNLLTSHANNEKADNKPILIFGCVTINRYKYSDTTLLTQALLIKDGKSFDLTRTKIPRKDKTN